jgi:hypothetical protein
MEICYLVSVTSFLPGAISLLYPCFVRTFPRVPLATIHIQNEDNKIYIYPVITMTQSFKSTRILSQT